jgi:hypothetical protein
MSLIPRSIALRGMGYGPLAMAMLGFQQAPAQVQPGQGAPGGVWPFGYPKSSHVSHYHPPESRRSLRPRRVREADFLLMHHL